MKRVVVGLMMVMMLTWAVVVWAADEGQAQKDTQQSQVQTPKGPAMRPNMPMRGRGPNVQGPAGMQEAYQEMIKRREEEHKKAMAELEEIKKIAEGEKATKTVEALQKMIDNKNAEFKKNVEEAEKKRAERMEQLRLRQQQAVPAPADAKTGAKAETPAEKVAK
jgi:hypothetical protein